MVGKIIIIKSSQMKNIVYIIGLSLLIFSSCSKDTEDISKVTAFPTFEPTGKVLENILREDNGQFVDPGTKAYLDGVEFPVTVTGTVDIKKEGLYQLNYKTESLDGFPVFFMRKFLITNEPVTEDYAGTYKLVSATRSQTIQITKVMGEIGYYKASDSWWQQYPIAFEFIDLSGERYSAFSGTSRYGDFKMACTYDNSTKTFTFNGEFTAGTNTGAKWTSSWVKQ